MWSTKNAATAARLAKLDSIQNRLIKAAKDSDIDKVRELLKEVELVGQGRKKNSMWAICGFAFITVFFTLTIGLLAFTWTSDG